MKPHPTQSTHNRNKARFSRKLITGVISAVALAAALALFFLLDLGSFQPGFAAGDLSQLSEKKYQKSDYVPGRIILKIKDAYRSSCSLNHIGIPKLETQLNEIGLTNLGKIFPTAQKPWEKHNALRQTMVDISLIYEIQIDTSFSIEAALEILNHNQAVEYAEPRFIYESFYAPNDPKIGKQYYLEAINALQAWDLNRGDTSVVIGMIDTGTSFGHPDLQDKVAINLADPLDGIDNDNDGYIDNYRGWDFGGNTLSSPPDNDASYAGSLNGADHGVLVTGVAVAKADNGIGIAGVGFNCKYVPLKAAYDNSTGIAYGFDAIIYGADRGYPILNLSWGFNGYSQYGQDVVNYAAINKGVLLVAAAGNTPEDIMFYPASYDNVLSVAGTQAAWINNVQEHDYVWLSNALYGTSYNYLIDISAPARNIRTTSQTSQYYGGATGTSMAAPIVSAAAGIVKAANPSLTNLQIGQLLRVTSDEIYWRNTDSKYQDRLGFGRVDILDALNQSGPSVRIDSIYFRDDNNNRPEAFDTLDVFAKFINYLDATSNLTVTLTSPDTSCIEIITASQSLGSMATLTYKTNNFPFRIVIKGDCMVEIDKWLKFSFSDPATSYQDFQYRKFSISPICIPIDVNQLHLSITPKGEIGFGDPPENTVGLGWDFSGFGNALSNGGFLMGTSSSKMSDALKSQISLPGSDFIMENQPLIKIPGNIAAKEVFCEFSDAGSLYPQGINVKQNTYAFTQSGQDGFVIMEYVIHNSTQTTYQNFNAGLLLQWGSNGINASSSGYDPANSLLYAELSTSQQSGSNKYYSGMSILSDQTAVPFNSTTFNFSFSDADKFQALSNGNAPIGALSGSLIQSLSANQLTLAAGDSIIVAFALAAGNSLQDLSSQVQEAFHIYRCVIRGQMSHLDLGPDQSDCAKNGPIVVDANLGAGHTYIWSGGQTSASIPISTSGTYWVEVFSQDGCLATDTINIELVNGTQTVTANKTVANINESITFSSDAPTGTQSFAWDFGDGTGSSNLLHPVYNYSNSGTYEVTLITGNGYCFDTNSLSIIINSLATETGQNIGEGKVSLFPNPAQDYIIARFGSNFRGQVDFEIFNLQGKMVRKSLQNKTETSIETKLDLEALPAGAFLLKISQASDSETLRFIIQ